MATSAAPPGAKAIIVFSDGTGNSAAKLNKTNVWRLYEALDLAPPTAAQMAAGDLPQVALYDDGVGATGFRPLSLLAGVFGYGLRRNVLDLYAFLCRNYRPGDRIYAFGFSRGAFTVRRLMGLVDKLGLVHYRSERQLDSAVRAAYREYRRGFTGVLLAGAFWHLRDGIGQFLTAVAHGVRRLLGHPPADGEPLADLIAVPEIHFIGVWDTVSAYGMPLAELTHAVDRWIWPLAMPDYALPLKVRTARHALALDDERDTFHPLLWDEVSEKAAVDRGDVPPGRIRQLWFAGMHSDVGGGYPDASLSYVSLHWMAEEAITAGLRLKPATRVAIAAEQNPCGTMHDSRAGLGCYYRYQPRKLSARREVPGAADLVMRDPVSPEARGRLLGVQVHPSVLERIARSTNSYAPITLPHSFQVAPVQGAQARTVTFGVSLRRVWNLVWCRRIGYFLGLADTLALLSMRWLPPADCSGAQCLVSPALSAAGELLPGFVRPWVTAWANHPGLFIVLSVAMALWLSASQRVKRALDDEMGAIWRHTLQGGPAPQPFSKGSRVLYRLRSHPVYQRGLRWLKWRGLPGLAAMILVPLMGLVAVTVAYRAWLGSVDVPTRYCAATKVAAPVSTAPVAAHGSFDTRSACWTTGLAVEAGAVYGLRMQVGDSWSDGGIKTTPAGFSSLQRGWTFMLAPLRRSTTAGWFEPVLTVRDRHGRTHTFPVRMKPEEPRELRGPHPVYIGSFEAPADGVVYLYVNDLLVPGWDDADGWPRFYGNNRGTASVTLARMPRAQRPEEPAE